jgi:hypothetical protein
VTIKYTIRRKLLSFLGSVALSVNAIASPMESFENYNVILVHGASHNQDGLHCETTEYGEASSYGRVKKDDKWKGLVSRLSYEEDYSDAVGTVRHLYPWIANIFEGDLDIAYLQRPFTNPAGTPWDNAKELGDRRWKGENKCEKRRALIEEAQEVRAVGQVSLRKMRDDTTSLSYRQIPSRNILIAHSMGGVASREYVQGYWYNEDVDKVITLDSPHDGTGSLNMVTDILSFDWRALRSGAQTALYAAFALPMMQTADPTLMALGILLLGMPVYSIVKS